MSGEEVSAFRSKSCLLAFDSLFSAQLSPCITDCPRKGGIEQREKETARRVRYRHNHIAYKPAGIYANFPSRKDLSTWACFHKLAKPACFVLEVFTLYGDTFTSLAVRLGGAAGRRFYLVLVLFLLLLLLLLFVILD